MKRIVFLSLVIAVLCLLSQNNALAIGKLYGRIPWLIHSPIDPLAIKNYDVEVTIIDQLVTTRVTQEFTNSSWQQLEGVFVAELPEDAHITSLALWKNGERIDYELKTLDEARVVYQEIVKRENDELFPENETGNVFRLRIFPVEAQSTCKIEFSYFHLLKPLQNMFVYSFPLDLTDYTETPVESGRIEININSQFRLHAIHAPANAELIQFTQNSCRITCEADNELPDTDFTVDFKIDQQGNFFNLLTCTTPEDTFDYFTLWITPPDSLFQDTILVKEIVFVVDQSASMEGRRLNHLKQALYYYLDQLNQVQRFNILPFSNNVSKFRPDLVPATPSMLEAAKTYISRLSADALANLEAALQEALRQNFTDWTQRIIIVFTDGRPNAGVKDNATILYNIAQANQNDVSIFPVGIGNEIDQILLNSLATQNKGYPFYVADDDSLNASLQALYPKIMVPVLTDISLDYKTILTRDLFPRDLSNMVKGVQQVIRGRYQGSGTIRLALNGKVGKTPVVLEGPVAFIENNNFQVARLWAASKINYYQNLILQYGHEQELVDAIVAFSQEYSILTPYTAFFLIEPGEGIPSSIQDSEPAVSSESFALGQNFPNPFNPSTQIKYRIGGVPGKLSKVTVKIYDATGRLVRILVNTTQRPGEYEVTWDGLDNRQQPVASGQYFYQIKAGEFVLSRRMILVK